MTETWRAAYRMMQKLGIKFECRLISGDWHSTKLVFNEEQRYYRIAPDQTPPENWREIYKAAQALGVSFDFSRDFSYVWVNGASSFNGEFNEYRLHIEEPPKRTIEINGRELPAPDDATGGRIGDYMLLRGGQFPASIGLLRFGWKNQEDRDAVEAAIIAALEGKK